MTKQYLGKARGYDVYTADDAEVEKYQAGLRRFLIVIAPYVSKKRTPEEWADNVFVSDQSTVGDFGLSEKELEEVSKKLGFKVTNESFIKDVAATN